MRQRLSVASMSQTSLKVGVSFLTFIRLPCRPRQSDMISQMTRDRNFRVGFSTDFLDERKQLIFPDIGLSLLEAERAISHEF